MMISFEQKRLDLARVPVVVNHDGSINAKQAVKCFGADGMRMRARFSKHHQVNDIDDSNSGAFFLQDTSSSLASQTKKY
jgi:hypothetical protein